MSHNNHVIDNLNKDVGVLGYKGAKEYYLSLTEGWEPYNPDPIVMMHDGVRVVRDDLTTGTKTKDVVLFMPASKRISLHQACCIERGAIPKFERIAAMPNLNKKAKEYANETNGFFVPLGLKHELATAGIVHAASKIDPPDEVYVAISTGVLSRALQIAWPKAIFTCIAVARNLKSGELGRADVISEPLPFQTLEKKENLPPFPTVASYDGKVWKYIPKNTGKNILFWNVGSEPQLTNDSIYDTIESYREWDKNLK